MKHKLAACFTLVLLAGCAQQPPATGGSGQYEPVDTGNEFHVYKVTRDVTVRSAPHAGADSQGKLESGDRLKALTTKRAEDNWTQVRLPDNRRGYVLGFPFDRLQ